MINYTKKNVLMITLIITVIIYVFMSVIWSNINKEEVILENTKENKVQTQVTQENEKVNEHIWQIQIPIINLTADIAEGTTPNVISKYVGHFTQTTTLEGNVGLAAHNRGIGVESYFKSIKKLSIGDEIIYKKDKEIRKYKVVQNLIIDETDWTYLKETNDNRITLITCVENQPEYRRCVQAIEVL